MLPPKTIEALKQFILDQDKSYPPTFVGRKDVITTIRNMSENVYKKYKNDSFQPAATQLVHGAPGAGKSSLLMHLQKAVAWKDFKDIYGTSQPDPLVLYLAGPARFTDLNSFGHELKTCLTDGHRRSLSTIKKTITEGSAGIGSYIKFGRAVESHNEFHDPIEAIIRDRSIIWNRPLIIAIDEFQNIRGDWNKKENQVSQLHVGILRNLHDGAYGKPIMLVLGGLCDVPDILFKCGITRFPNDNNHPIGAFKRDCESDDDETKELIEAWREKFEIPEGQWQEEIFQMAEEGSHWPMHIHNSLRALAKEIVDNNVEMNHWNLKRVRENAAEMRKSYYNLRISRELGESKYLLAKVMKKIPAHGEQGSNIDIVDIVDRISETISKPPSKSSGWQIPDGLENAKGYAAHLVHQGLIQMKEDKFFYCPIPSLKSYVLEHCSPSSN